MFKYCNNHFNGVGYTRLEGYVAKFENLTRNLLKFLAQEKTKITIFFKLFLQALNNCSS